jgi:serine/threonine protein kinase
MFQFTSEQFRVKVGLAEMLKGGVIMDVTNADQAKIAEDAGASAVMALERVPADIRKEGGVARMATDATLTAVRMLTPDYASPEQVAGGRMSTATDIYSLGAVLYQLLTGKPAHEFEDRSLEAIASAIATREVTRPSTWTPELKGDLEVILLKALRKDPQERYATVE